MKTKAVSTNENSQHRAIRPQACHFRSFVRSDQINSSSETAVMQFKIPRSSPQKQYPAPSDKPFMDVEKDLTDGRGLSEDDISERPHPNGGTTGHKDGV